MFCKLLFTLSHFNLYVTVLGGQRALFMLSCNRFQHACVRQTFRGYRSVSSAESEGSVSGVSEREQSAASGFPFVIVRKLSACARAEPAAAAFGSQRPGHTAAVGLVALNAACHRPGHAPPLTPHRPQIRRCRLPEPRARQGATPPPHARGARAALPQGAQRPPGV